jgi:peptide/nickel transport system substrate-binding protein
MKKMILILTILFCSMTFSATALAEDEKIVIIPGDRGKVPSLFGLSLTSSDYFAMTLIFDTLTWKDADGVIPALADGWEVSDDGKEWTFYLTRNARWHDGELFTADDVKFTFDYMKDHPLDA